MNAIAQAVNNALPVAAANCTAPSTIGGAFNQCSHVANAHRIVKHYGDRLLYVEGIGWHTFGPPWREDELGAAKLAQGLGKIIAQEAAAMAPWVASANSTAERDERQKAMDARFKFAGQSESEQTVQLSLQAARPHLACKAADMDANPMLLGLPHGVLDLATGEHREHRQIDRITKITGCDFDPNATAPTWERFIGETFNGDVELIDYMGRLGGYTLSGQRGEHLLTVFHGSGANGKTTFLSTVQAVLGDYASTSAPGLLIQRNGPEHPTGLADLQGRRLVVVSETGEAGKLNEEQAKLLTGGDTIKARRMRQDFYEFPPTHQLILQTNHRPRVTGTDEGVWRRLRLIPFAVTVAQDKRDTHLAEKLRAELPGILTWCWHGWQRYREHGFNDPQAVRLATSEYRESSDVVGAFLTDCCTLDKMLSSKAGELYKRYADWCIAAGERPRSQREFGTGLAERGFEQSKGTGGIRIWRGLGLSDSGASGASGPDSRLSPREEKPLWVNPEMAVIRHLRHSPETCPKCGGEGCDWCTSRAGLQP